MSGGQSRRVQIGLLIIGLFACASQLQALRSAFVAYRTVPHTDEASRYDARFRELRQALPGKGVVGYVTDTPLAAKDPQSAQARRSFRRYLLTQYALVPLVVLRSVDPEVVVGDFAAPAHEGDLGPPGFVVVKDFGQGVVLFRRLPR